jgi:hypothetical protein
MTITLFVGDCTEELADSAKQFDNTAYLIDFSNFDRYLKSSDGNITAYTSAADLPKISKDRAVFYEVLKKADKIYYRPPQRWSDYDPEFAFHSQQRLTEYFLFLIDQERHNVDGLDLMPYARTPYLSLQDTRVGNQSQLWIAGCSFTAGVGVNENERYAVKVAEIFGGKFSDLSKSGSSIEHAADQILRSDIRKNDTVVWTLTSEYRAPYWDRAAQEALGINSHSLKQKKNASKADDVTDETRLYKAVISFNQVANFCTKIGARLVAVPNLICTEELQLLLGTHPCYYQLPYQTFYLDIGSDGEHPGPKHHQWHADQIIKILT